MGLKLTAWSVMHLTHNLNFLGENYALMINIGVKEWVQFRYLNSVEEHAGFVNLFVLIFVWIITVYPLKLFCSATVLLCDTIVLSRARHIRLTSIDTSKWYWDGNSLYRKMTFPKCSAPVCSCIPHTYISLVPFLNGPTGGDEHPTLTSLLCHTWTAPLEAMSTPHLHLSCAIPEWPHRRRWAPHNDISLVLFLSGSTRCDEHPSLTSLLRHSWLAPLEAISTPSWHLSCAIPERPH